mgnify:CR=1 FL=1
MLVVLVTLLAVQGILSQSATTSIGEVRIIGLKDSVPIGWEDMSYEEGCEIQK